MKHITRILAKSSAALLAAPLALPLFAAPAASDNPKSAIQNPKSPNVIVILTDDQSYAELGATGNPVIRTPNLDRFARQSVSLVNFNTMPVCSPTRACLMIGRDYYRSGLTDTWMGRSMMDPSTTTLAQMFADHGYRTGIFGKWHLGDNYPRRAMDKGFQESLVLNGGGLGQPSDAPDPADELGAYFNAHMLHNGKWITTDGYVSDVITAAAMQFIEQNRDRPFFVYLPFNCPHSPHQVPDEYRKHYPPASFDPAKYPAAGNPIPTKRNPEELARVYGMVENIDDNIGRLLAQLDELKLADDTIVVFFSDNGSQQHAGYNGGLRGWKGSTFEGGIHQFCFIRWPAQLKAGTQVTPIASVIDLAPTLLDLAAAQPPQQTTATFDGRSLVPLMRGTQTAADWPDRALFFQWHRGDTPERYRTMSVRTQNWKLVQPLGGGGETWNGKTNFMLFDMATDPFEMHNVAEQHPGRVAEMKKTYDTWFDNILRNRDFDKPQRITVGAPQENPVLLTRQDWRGPKANWSPAGHGFWEISVVTAARYDIKIYFDPFKKDGEASIAFPGARGLRKFFAAGDTELVFKNIALPARDGRFEVTVKTELSVRGVKYVELTRLP
ncbi:arylsulfatase [Termitidicoccus mucosus]|uniref:Sulfatase N-terminal domain-containing protein n=1 Tax=Termitidicoccus mucosus TaxID=1184151 RepID=A0A178IP70_9BACT|nr:hypothetical protein AW736_05180 [Opitutaceae bacterium TSB47]